MLRGPGKETADAHQLQEGRVACERGCVGSGSLVGYAACVRPWVSSAAKQERSRE